MARTSKLDGKKPPQEVVEKLIETIIEDVIKAAAMPFTEWWALNKFPLTPLAIPVGLEREYRVTQVGVDAAHELTDQTWRKRPDFRQTIARKEFNRLSFMAIGQAVLNCRTHLPRDAERSETSSPDEAFYVNVVTDYESNLENLADRARPDVDRHVPCHLFHSDQAVPGFAVGPVEFLPRADWLNRFVKESAQLLLIREVESGQISADELQERALGSGSDKDSRAAWSILNSLGNFEWVATVRMSGHELVQSHQKASVIVGLAIDAIGLRFQVEDARRFTKAGRQHLYSEYRLATSPEGAFLGGSSVQMPGLGSKPEALAAKMAAERPFFDAAGTVLKAYLEGRQIGRAPHLVERWANALYWVGEALREASDFMAIVNYGCAADGLSGAGGVANKMTAFAEAALNPMGRPALPASLSIADAVTKVYREGRNKLAHGEMSGLLEDLSDTRRVGEGLLVSLFDVVTFELAEIIMNRTQILAVEEEHAYRAFEARLRQRTRRVP